MKRAGPQRITRVGIVSSEPIRVGGLQAVLGEDAGFEWISLSAPAALKTPGVELVVIDSGATDHLYALIAEFRRSQPGLRVLVLGVGSRTEHVERVLDAGARGYVSPGAGEEELRQALEAVLEGSFWAPRKVLARMLDSPRSGAERGADRPKFTRREREVLKFLSQGYPNREIAHAMGVNEGTIKAHIGRLMRKLGVDNRTALTMRALERQPFEREG